MMDTNVTRKYSWRMTCGANNVLDAGVWVPGAINSTEIVNQNLR